jgi:hypothetical protein
MESIESTDKKVSEDTTDADLEAILKGLKQEQLDTIAKQLSKKTTAPDMSVRWNEAKEKMKRSNRISGIADRIYLENRKGPYHFESIKEYNEYDLMCRKNATTEAIRRVVAEEMAQKDE